MNEPFASPEPEKESNIINFLIAGAGVIMMLCACSLLPLIAIKNINSQILALEPTLVPVSGGEKSSNSAKRIQEAPAGSQQIEALAYSSQTPVVVMFDADW